MSVDGVEDDSQATHLVTLMWQTVGFPQVPREYLLQDLGIFPGFDVKSVLVRRCQKPKKQATALAFQSGTRVVLYRCG